VQIGQVKNTHARTSALGTFAERLATLRAQRIGLQSADGLQNQTNPAVTLLPFAWDDAPGPLSQRLAASLREAVTVGRLTAGERLPASRILAQDLGVSRWVVTDAYQQLTAEGYLSGRTGAGTFVADVHPPAQDLPGARARHQAQVQAHAGQYDLRPNLPDLRSFPHAPWRAAAARAVASLGPRELGYPDPHGDLALRRVLADYLRRVRGLAVDPADLLITSGTTHSLSVLFRALSRTGQTRVAVEDPGWPRVPAALRTAGLEPVPVPVDADGLTTDRLSALDVQAVCVTPAHQFPTGVAMSAPRRQQLLEWATGSRLVVEDDYDAEFRYDRRPVSALAALGGPRVVYLGSCSKTLAPGVRIGWLIAPGSTGSAVQEVLGSDPAGPSTMDQRTLAELIASGAYDTHLRRMRTSYRNRRAEFLSSLRAALPAARIAGLKAGVHCLLELDGADDTAAAHQLAQQGISVMPLSACRHLPTQPQGLLLGYANLPSHHHRRVAQAVAAVVTSSAPMD
jgi:GntR family transcriptional regulator/MocR family aminotransferase